MKALPRRKGNLRWLVRACSANLTLNESPSEKEGKLEAKRAGILSIPPNESPSEKEGKLERPHIAASWEGTLNESPSEKEGKFDPRDTPQLGGFSPQ